MSRPRSRPDTRDRGIHRLGTGENWREAFENRPPWADSVLLRRILAALCACTAAILLFRDDPEHTRIPVVVAARDLPPGHLLEPDDLRLARLPGDTAPHGTTPDPETLTGAVLTAALRTGEALTDVRVVGPRLAEAATGFPEARIVPLTLADTAISEILRAGDRVDVIAADATDPTRSTTLATDAAVVLVSGAAPAEPDIRHDERVVLVALDARRATAVAAASLSSALTVIFH